MNISWSAKPGCFERHLQRKHQNPLFPQRSRSVTQEEVDIARDRDQAEVAAFRNELGLLIARAADVSAMATGSAFELREKLDAMLRRAAEIGGDLTKEIIDLNRLHSALVKDLKTALETKADPANRFASAGSNRATLIHSYNEPFIVQASRRDTPITGEEFVPSLLSEDIVTIEHAIELMEFDQDTLAKLRQEAIRLVTELKADGTNVPGIDSKLAVLGVKPSGV